MAKKAVATFKKGDGRTYSKVIKMVKSPKTGAYIFQEEMIPNEAVKDYFAKYRSVISRYEERSFSIAGRTSFFVFIRVVIWNIFILLCGRICSCPIGNSL